MFWQNLRWRWIEFQERTKWDARHPSIWEPIRGRDDFYAR